MKKELAAQFSFLIAYSLLVSVYRGWFSLNYAVFWLGGVLGTLLPYTDHLIYIYFLKPQEEISQKAAQELGQKNVKGVFGRTKHLFHTAHFQIIFLALSLLVITSSGSIFGRGIVLAFVLHLLIDQYIDFTKNGSLKDWFRQIPIELDKTQTRFYLLANLGVFLIFAFLL